MWSINVQLNARDALLPPHAQEQLCPLAARHNLLGGPLPPYAFEWLPSLSYTLPYCSFLPLCIGKVDNDGGFPCLSVCSLGCVPPLPFFIRGVPAWAATSRYGRIEVQLWSALCYGTLRTHGLGTMSLLQMATPTFSLHGPLNTLTLKALWGVNWVLGLRPSHTAPFDSSSVCLSTKRTFAASSLKKLTKWEYRRVCSWHKLSLERPLLLSQLADRPYQLCLLKSTLTLSLKTQLKTALIHWGAQPKFPHCCHRS